MALSAKVVIEVLYYRETLGAPPPCASTCPPQNLGAGLRPGVGGAPGGPQQWAEQSDLTRGQSSWVLELAL